MLGRTRRVHFVGVGGSGMSGIAEVLVTLGYLVSGSDLKRSEVTDRLEGLGVTVHEGHASRNIGDADVVVFSSAVRPSNPEIVEAIRRHVPVIPRAEMLAELMRLRYSIAVAGAHGKTTTTSMVALVLERAGLDPTAVIGGRLSAFGSNARLGRGDYIVAEADESDRSFLKLTPTIAVVTNIDREHLESYRDFDDLRQAFVDFANKVPFYGAVVACADNEHVRSVLPRMTRRVITYGLEWPGADYQATDVRLSGFGSSMVVKRLRSGDRPGAPGPLAGGHEQGAIQLGVPGRHNLQNALAAVAVADELAVAFPRTAAALADFRGAERRFQVKGEAAGVLVIDDYGHHPTEIAAVIATARAALDRRIVVVFQPHRYTRTRQLLDQFGPALRGADEIILTDIYAAGEDPIAGVTVESLADAIRQSVRSPVHLVARLDDVVPAVATLARRGDVVLTLGAGSIGGLGRQIVDALGVRGEAGDDAGTRTRGEG
ncbi:MAG: UDP-N-acetylmuramate--L-alanine ligase [Planctomycetes bacterium]|nr:UDP-N-acetylmuramate--L-alanine ligase [Planctomycetota bacterium]